jgi:tricarboxylate carrier
MNEYSGRLTNMLEMIDPRTLFIGSEEVAAARQDLDYFKEHGAAPEGKGDADMWDAKRKLGAVIHPATDEEMFIPGRMSAFLPMNVPICFGMLTLATTPMSTVFWQWVNQSYNVVNNYTNRSSKDVDDVALAKAYALAVGASCGIAVAAGKAMAKAPPAVRMLGPFVPYLAVITAGASNVGFTRMDEIQNGIPVMDPTTGDVLGVSKAAGFEAVKSTIVSRSCFLPIFPLVIPPAVMLMARKLKAVQASRPLSLVIEVTTITCCMGLGLPCALAIFPPQMSMDISKLEPEFQNKAGKDGKKLTYVHYNKGL